MNRTEHRRNTGAFKLYTWEINDQGGQDFKKCNFEFTIILKMFGVFKL